MSFSSDLQKLKKPPGGVLSPPVAKIVISSNSVRSGGASYHYPYNNNALNKTYKKDRTDDVAKGLVGIRRHASVFLFGLVYRVSRVNARRRVYELFLYQHEYAPRCTIGIRKWDFPYRNDN